MLKVPLADLHTQYLQMKTEIDSAIQDVLESSQFVLGKAVVKFELAFAAAHQVKHCVGVGSGTDALHTALWGVEVARGDAVITTPYTFIATVEAITFTGAQPLFVDIEPCSYTMDPQQLNDLLNSMKSKRSLHVKAILPIHLYGQPAAMDEIVEIGNKFGTAIIEDACQAHLAIYDNQFVGNFGKAACFSFYPVKNLGAYGEAGAVLTNDDILAQKIRQLRDHGQSKKYMHEFCGHNYRMDEIQGAVLGVKLKYLSRLTERRRNIAAQYKQLLNGVGDLVLPIESPKAQHVYHLFVVRTSQRSELKKFLTEKGIATAFHYPLPIHYQQAFRHLGYQKGAFPVSEAAAEQCLSLPLYPEMTDDQVQYVASSVKTFFKSS